MRSSGHRSARNLVSMLRFLLLQTVFVSFLLFLVFFLAVLRGMWESRILVPWPGIEPVPPAVEVRSPNHWTTKESLYMMSILWNLLFLVACYIIIFQECSKHISLLHAKSYLKLLVSVYSLCYYILLFCYFIVCVIHQFPRV